MISKKALIIWGPGKTGKTTLAEKIAKARGCYVMTDYSELASAFGLGRLMRSNPSTVIVEGLTSKELCRDHIKGLVSEVVLVVREKYQEERLVQAPKFIFTMLERPQLLDGGAWRRFNIVEAKGAANAQ